MRCAYCDIPGDNVVVVGKCTNKCVVVAHPDCFHDRHRSKSFRKKHRTRESHESEVCPVKGCCGKFQVTKLRNASQSVHSFPPLSKEKHRRTTETKRTETTQTANSCVQCSFSDDALESLREQLASMERLLEEEREEHSRAMEELRKEVVRETGDAIDLALRLVRGFD